MAVPQRAGGWRVEVTGGADLGGAEGGWGVVTDEAGWGVVGCRLVRPYGCFPCEGTGVGGDRPGAKQGREKDMWVDAAALGASRERRICKRPTSKEWRFFY